MVVQEIDVEQLVERGHGPSSSRIAFLFGPTQSLASTCTACSFGIGFYVFYVFHGFYESLVTLLLRGRWTLSRSS